jgi:hypothetical protein
MSSNFKQHFQIEKSIWKRPNNIDVWIDQYGRVRNMSDKNPEKFKTGEGWQRADITHLRTFLPQNAAGVSYNDPYRCHGNNPNAWYIDNNYMLHFF